MLSAYRTVSNDLRRSYAARNGGSGFYTLIKTQGALGNSRTELESSWLVIKGGSGNSLREQWGTYLGTKGFTTGSLEERMRAFFATGTQA